MVVICMFPENRLCFLLFNYANFLSYFLASLPQKGKSKACIHPTILKTNLWDYTGYVECQKLSSDNTS